MNIFFDLEFTGLHQNTTIISFGACDEEITGHQFYRELSDYDESQCDDWIKENVLKHLGHYGTPPITREQLRHDLQMWLGSYDEDIIMWGDCCAYDWVLFCELFGGALHVPKFIHYIPRDISTLFEAKGIDPDVSRIGFMEHLESRKTLEHHALADATLIRQCYNRLQEIAFTDEEGWSYTKPETFD